MLVTLGFFLDAFLSVHFWPSSFCSRAFALAVSLWPLLPVHVLRESPTWNSFAVNSELLIPLPARP